MNINKARIVVFGARNTRNFSFQPENQDVEIAEKLSRSIYNHMMRQQNSRFKWFNKIKEVLYSVGRPDLWLHQHSINDKLIHKSIKQTLLNP